MSRYICILGLLALTGRLAAQCPTNAATPFDAARGGVLTTSGALINSQPGSVWTQDGGLDNSDGGTMEINGDVYINGDLRLSNNTDIVINSGGRLFVYGNVYINSGSVFTVNNGGNMYFYGSEWVNEPGAVINNSGGAGTITYVQPLPAPGATDPVSGSARYPDNATAYTAAGSAVQYMDGGGIEMAVNMTNQNANNISLCNLDNSAAAGSGDTRLSGILSFAALEGDVLLNDNNFIFSSGSFPTHSGINAYDAYFVTNGTGELQKENFGIDTVFTFPVGRSENDYTPVDIENTSDAANNYHIQVKTYAASGSTELAPAEGIDRTWQIYSSNGGTATICLDHNSSTNPAGTGTDGTNFDNANAFVTQQINTGIWSSGTQTDGGSPVSNHCGSFTLATSSTEATGYFSKSSDPATPLPLTLRSFAGDMNNCSAQLKWSTASEINSSRFIVEYSTNSVDFVPVATIASKDDPNGASYSYTYNDVQPGTGFFRLNMIDKNNRHEYSAIVGVRSDCRSQIVITPNPVQDVLKIRGLNSGSQVLVYNAAGQQITNARAVSSFLHIPTTAWSKGLYMVMIKENGRIVKTEKLLK